MDNIRTQDIKNLKAIIIDDSTNVKITNKDCIFELFIEYKDGTTEIVTVTDINDVATREELTKLFSKCLRDSDLNKNIVNGMIQDSNNIQLYKISDTKKLEEYNKALDSVEDKEKKSNVGKILAAAGIIALAGLAGCAAKEYIDNNKQTEVEVTNETTDEIVKPSMEGQDWDYYIDTAISNKQKEAWTSIGDFLLSFNNSQEWMERTNENGDLSRFGFTPEETMAFYLRFNDFTDEQLITICNGANINADEIMNLSNDFLEKMNLYYSITGEVTGIDKLFINEHDQEVVKTFEMHHKKVMSAEDKEKEELMQEEKQMFMDYFNSDIEGKETKARQGSTSYLLRTMLPADQKLSDVANYKDTMLIYKTGNGDSVEVKVDLFDEVFMSRYVQGFDNFDEEHFLKQLGYNPDKYYVGLDGEKISIADLSCGEQEQKLRDADEYRVEVETSSQVIEDNRKALEAELAVYVDKDGKIDANQVAQAIDNMEFDSEQATIDELTKYSYDNNLIAGMLSSKLEELNKNAMYANTFHEYLTNLILEDTLGNMNLTASRRTTTTAGQVILETTDRNAVLAVPGITEADVAAAEEKAAKEAGAERDTEETKKKHEDEAKKDMVEKQEVYDKTYSYYANGGTGEYNSGWANSSDSDIREVYQLGKQDGINNLYTTVYNNTYNYYINGGTGEYNSSYANSSNSTIKNAYSSGKSDGLAAYKAANPETPKPTEPPVIVEPTPTEPPVNPEPTEPPVENPTDEPVVTPEPTEPPVETPEPTEPPVETPTETPEDYAPIVDPILPSSDDIMWSDEDIISQLNFDDIETYSADFSSMDEAASDLEEEPVQKVK